MVEDAGASLQKCTLHQRSLLLARSNLARRLGELSHIQNRLQDAECKLLDLDQKLPVLYEAMAPIRKHAAYASGLASRVDGALDHASAVLDIFKSIQATERKLRYDDPRHDLRKYLAMVCSMERYLHVLQDTYGPSLHWLEGVVTYLNQSRAIDKYSLSKLWHELEQSKSLDPYAELMNLNNGGLLSAPLQKLENEFGRLLEENCAVVDLPDYVKACDILDSPKASATSPPVVTLIKQDAINQLLVIADRLRVNGRLEQCLRRYREARGRIVKKSMATLKPEYLRHSSAEALKSHKWEEVHEFLYSWLQDVGVVVWVLLANERELCNQVFPTLDPPSERVKLFEDVVRESKFSLFFRFAEEVACTQHRPEALIVGLLDLVKGTSKLQDDVVKVFKGCRDTPAEFADLQRILVENVCRAFWDLVKEVETRQSKVPNDGGKDWNASFVVNYMGMLLRDYPSAMELAFISQHTYSKNAGPRVEASLSSAASSMMDSLERSLEDRASTGYHDPILAHVFLMNNYRHVLVRLKDCEALSTCLGEEFKVQWRKKVDQNMRSYLRKAWEKVLAHLSREGPQHSSGRSLSKDFLRSKLRAFNVSFEETCKQQQGWVILDDQLRESVQIAIIQYLVPAYHSFVHSNATVLEESTHGNKRSVVKYSGDMLQSIIGDMFIIKPSD